jgi:hypothetical protein
LTVHIMKYYIIVLLVVAVAAATEYTNEDLKGYQNWMIKNTEISLEFLEKFKSEFDRRVIFWHSDHPLSLDQDEEVLVSPEYCQGGLKEALEDMGATITVLNTDIYKSIQATLERREARHKQGNPDNYYDENDYNDYVDIIGEVIRLESQCYSPAVNCKATVIGQSTEGRDIFRFEMTTGGGGKPVIWLDSLIHAREWLAGSTVMRILAKLVREYPSDPDVAWLVDNYDIYFVPVMNPDGYEYSWKSDRMWRKGRNLNSNGCYGTDLNRNYDSCWSCDGTSTNPCSDTYHGPGRASEPETQTIQAEAGSMGSNVFIWLSFHSTYYAYLIPYGHTTSGRCTVPSDYAELTRVGQAGMDAIYQVSGRAWRAENVCSILYAASGGTMDYVKSVGGKYVYTPELRGPGFDPPTSAINPSFNENWAALVAMEAAAAGRK